MRLVIKIKDKNKGLNKEKTYDRIIQPLEMNDEERSAGELESEEKKARLGSAPDGKCKPERGDFACYMVDSPSSTEHSKGVIKTEPTKPQTGYRKGKT